MDQVEAISVVCVKRGDVELNIGSYRFCAFSQSQKRVGLTVLDPLFVLRVNVKLD